MFALVLVSVWIRADSRPVIESFVEATEVDVSCSVYETTHSMWLPVLVEAFEDGAIGEDFDTSTLLDFRGQTAFPLAEVDTFFHHF